MDRFQPTGWTPIAASMKEAKKDLLSAKDEEAVNLVYIVSDGMETCGGDPVQAAKELNASDIQAVVNIIGFDVDNSGQKALRKVAEAGGGEYETVQNDKELRRYFDSLNTEMWLEWGRWGTDKWLNINHEYHDRLDQLRGIASGSGGFGKKIEREHKRMEEAIEYLREKNRLTDKEQEKLEDLVDDREDQLDEYRNKKYWGLRDVLKKNSDDLLSKIEKKEQEMLDKYE
ncbi:hypothetical protein CHM34_17925 [Paludifilum halophilum]|uniref:VWFA domain-containing protein n=1 Tax=Paludifilum halophilum TaxID=1642702 RepID=A0A235B1H8_9BACL|nr:hypothetical protein CHM34_17925 [Paludifilum halophilum]